MQGGSTITQELVRNLYLSRERTFKRKLIEACLAIKLARQWSKDRILTAYMNQVFYGNHAYGVEAAAETYFSRTAKELTLEQAALLAGLPQAPSSYDPFRNPEAALDRRNEVLHAMLVNGDITSSEYAPRQRADEPRAEARQALHPDPRAVLLQLRRGAAAAGVRLEHRARGRAQGLHDDQPRLAARGDGGDHARADRADRSRVGDRLDRSAHRRDQGDGGGDAGSRKATSSTSSRARAASRARRSRRSR